MEITQDYLIDKLVDSKSLDKLPLIEIQENDIEINCSSLSQDNMYLICGCQKGIVKVCNLKSKLHSRIILQYETDVSAVYLFQNNNFEERQYRIFIGTKDGNYYEYIIVEIEDRFNFESPKLPRIQEKKLNAPVQSIYYYEFILYMVSNNQVKVMGESREINVQNFSFEINTSIFAGNCLYLGLSTNQILRIPLVEIQDNIFAKNILPEYILYSAQSQFKLEKFSIYSNLEVTVLSVVLHDQNKTTVLFMNEQEITLETDKQINLINLIDQDYCFIAFNDFTYQITKQNFQKQKIQTIKEENYPSQIIVGSYLLNNSISYPTILLIDSQMSLSLYQIGIKANYQLPFIFWVWMRTIKDLELESLMSENYSNIIMAELKGKERGKMIQANQMVFQQNRFSRSQYYILNSITVASQVKILILNQVKEGQFRFFQLLTRSVKRMSQLKYFDISYCEINYNQQNLKELIETFQTMHLVLDFLGLAGLNIGKLFQVNQDDPLDESIFETHQIMKSIDQIAVNVSLRDNGFNDGQGRIILQRTREIKNLKMLDISNNPFQNQTLSVLQILMQQNNAFFYRFDEDFSLKMLCISFTDALQETAMKAATDYLIRRRMNNNLYIYITRKQDTLWDSSISEYWTKDLRKQKVTCMANAFTIIVEWVKTIFWVIKKKGFYCFQQMLCTAFFIKKYIICGFCTFLTSKVGKYCVALCGVEPSYYEFNDQQQELEQFLEEKHKTYFALLFINFAIYYSFVIALPVAFVHQCSQSTWSGHFIYIVYVVISLITELYIANEINQFKIAHQYQRGTRWERYSQIVKDLLISQLTKFTLFTCICFIVLSQSCATKSTIYVVAILIITFNQFVEFIMIIKNVVIPYRYQRVLITQMQIFTYLSMFLSMTMIRKQLQKWPKGENNYKFCGQEHGSFKVPRQVFQIITTLVLQDLPMLFIQFAHGAKNADQSINQILVCSMVILIIHCFYLVMKLLTITRAGLINEDVSLSELSKQLNQRTRMNTRLQRFIKNFRNRFNQFLITQQTRNEHIEESIRTDYFNYVIPVNERVLNKRQVHAQDQISRKKAILRQEDKKINFNQKVSQSQQFLNYYSQIYGKEVATWKPSNDMPYCIVDTLLIDVPRTFFTEDLQWIKQYDLIKNIKISSLHQEVEGFDYAYEFFKDKQELDILDLGFGSGYVSLVLLALALRRNPRMIVRLYLVDHIKETQKIFEQKLDTKFQNLKNRATFYFSNHDCLQGFTMFGEQKFDFIHMGFGATKWRIENQIIPLLRQHGKLFGYKLVTSALQKQFTWDNQVKQFKYNLNNNLENYGIMEPKVIQEYSAANRFINKNQFTYPDELNQLQFQIKLTNQCALCYQALETRQKKFINPYWGECICFTCGTDQLEQQGLEKDIGKLKYKSDVIFYSGLECQLQQINSLEYLFENRIYPMGEEKNRKYRIVCASCNPQSGHSKGFKYKCLVCEVQSFCNQCGLDFMNDQASNPQLIECFTKHPILRIMFPANQQDTYWANNQKAQGSQVMGSQIFGQMDQSIIQ